MSLSIYQRLLDAGAEIDHHESDLYVRIDATTAKIVREYQDETGISVSSFRSQIDGAQWFDIPFHYDPFWERKNG